MDKIERLGGDELTLFGQLTGSSTRTQCRQLTDSTRRTLSRRQRKALSGWQAACLRKARQRTGRSPRLQRNYVENLFLLKAFAVFLSKRLAARHNTKVGLWFFLIINLTIMLSHGDCSLTIAIQYFILSVNLTGIRYIESPSSVARRPQIFSETPFLQLRWPLE